MRWKSRLSELNRLRAEHRGKKYRVPMPDLSVERRGPPTSDRITSTLGKRTLPPDARVFPVGHSHKQGLEMLTPAMVAGALPDMSGRKT